MKATYAREEALNEIRNHVFMSALEKGLLCGERLYTIALPSDEIHGLVDRIISDFNNMPEEEFLADLNLNLFRGFLYMFERGVEISYFARTDRRANINYVFEDVLIGKPVDSIPTELQLRINRATGELAEILQSTLDYIDKNEQKLCKLDIFRDARMKLIFVGSAFLGLEFCLRVDFNSDNEKNL